MAACTVGCADALLRTSPQKKGGLGRQEKYLTKKSKVGSEPLSPRTL